jgi:putative DNA primase/helicase
MTRPSVLPVQLEGIPAELRAINRWVMWQLVQRSKPSGEKVWTKMPKTVAGNAASSTNPNTWSTFDDVCDALLMGDGFDGIGLVLGDDVHGIDLDDCIHPESGDLSDLAKDVLERVQGYAEVSPSGTGIKVFAKTNLDGSRTKKEVGVELYKDGRYFTVTGHQLNGHGHMADEVQDLDWFVWKVWGEQLSAADDVDADERALANYKPVLEDWDLDRVMTEVLPHLDPDGGYEEWLKVGAALHHQGVGAEDWLEVWDSWSSGSGKWVEGMCAAKWSSFSEQRNVGRGAVTLASLLKATKEKRAAAVRSERDQVMADLLDQIDQATDPRDLQEKIAAKAAHNGDLSDVERAQLASAIQLRAKSLGVKVEIGTVRGWLRPRVSASFPHLNNDGHPLCTLENFKVLLDRLGVIIRYNVIAKAFDVLVPGSGFSRDNKDNSALAYIFSECEKARMSTKFIVQFLPMVADMNQYNPVTTWIESQGWDGVSRLEKFYATVDTGGQMPEDLKKMLMRKWLVQAIGAAFSPDGIAAQGVLTFTGPQNIGKTTWFHKLAPEALDVILTGHTLDVRSKDSCLIVLKYWIVELGEIDATFRKSDVALLKSFITQAIDNIRRPYAMTESTYARRTVFGATVNDEWFLADPTGNRRFWTIPVVKFNLELFGSELDMQQLWAEVLELWKSGERWNLSMEETGVLGEHNDGFTAVDPIDERIGSGWAWGAGVVDWDWVTATDALMKIGVKDPTKYQTIAAARALKKMNGGQRKKSNGRVLFAIPGASTDFLG